MHRICVTLIFLGALPLDIAAQDRVTFLDRTSRSSTPIVRIGTITAEDPVRVTITGNDNRRSDVPSIDIVDVQYDAEPPEEMSGARAAERDRKWDAALAAYGDALKRAPAAHR
jgi:hypothetical protein